MMIAESTIAPMAMAMPPNDDAANDFAASVELGHAAPDVTAEMNVSDILQVNRCAVFHFEDDVLDVLNLFDVAASANVILGRRDFEDLAADIGITHLDRADDVAKRNVVSNQCVWIEVDLILLYEPADRRDFGNAFH